MKFRNKFTEPEHYISPNGGKTLTQQQFKDDCDINSIMRKFQKTGLIDHVDKHQLEYGFADSTTLHEAMNVVATAETMFAELPSSIRNKFNNSPSAFLDFVQDAGNYQEAKKIGISLAPEALERALELQDAAKTEEGDAKTPQGESPPGGEGKSDFPPGGA